MTQQFSDSAIQFSALALRASSFSTAKECFDIVKRSIDSFPGCIVPTDTLETLTELHIPNISLTEPHDEYALHGDLIKAKHFDVFINNYQDGNGGDDVYFVQVVHDDPKRCIGERYDNLIAFDPDVWDIKGAYVMFDDISQPTRFSPAFHVGIEKEGFYTVKEVLGRLNAHPIVELTDDYAHLAAGILGLSYGSHSLTRPCLSTSRIYRCSDMVITFPCDLNQ